MLSFFTFRNKYSLIHQFAASVFPVYAWVCGDGRVLDEPKSSPLSEQGAGCRRVSQGITNRLQTTELVNSGSQLTSLEQCFLFSLGS